jgi:hypothetical protein
MHTSYSIYINSVYHQLLSDKTPNRRVGQQLKTIIPYILHLHDMTLCEAKIIDRLNACFKPHAAIFKRDIVTTRFSTI